MTKGKIIVIEIESLIKLSKYSGMREDIIQAGGGNTSVKLTMKQCL